MHQEAFANLRNALAALYPEEISIRRIVADAGLDLSRIMFNTNAINVWHFVITEAEKTSQVGTLLEVVDREYGSNAEFRQACEAYQSSTGYVQKQVGMKITLDRAFKHYAPKEQERLLAAIRSILQADICITGIEQVV